MLPKGLSGSSRPRLKDHNTRPSPRGDLDYPIREANGYNHTMGWYKAKETFEVCPSSFSVTVFEM